MRRELRRIAGAACWAFFFAALTTSLPAAEPVANPADAPDFIRDVIPALTKLGCNAGACHGSFQGRGGLTLSLWGFDPLADYRVLVTDARGRRIFPAAPERSLILRKPTMAMPHGGGRRLSAGTEAYDIIRSWIARGAENPPDASLNVARLEVEPAEALVTRGQTAAVRVRATWSDGVVGDVTRWAQFETRDELTAAVSAEGQITAGNSGRTAITVRYQGQVAVVTVTVPYAPAAPLGEFAAANFIDTFVAAEWKKLGLAPAGRCDDAEFLRRASLDLIGTLPTVEEARAFLASADADKREKLVERLLARPEYAEFWAIKWSDLLRAHRRVLGDKGLASFNGWLKDALRQNRPWNEVVRELLAAKGNLYTTGPAAFYFVNQTPQELAEATAQVFLGVRMQCAKCHHHPFEVWSQEDYHGLAAFFARVQRKDTREGGRYGGAQSIWLSAEGSVLHPNTGLAVPPRLLGKDATLKADEADPRQFLAEWMTGPDNRLFARNAVNRYWGYLFGRGLVDPIDDLRNTNPPSHPALFDALTDDFIAHKYDFKHLLRTICTSRTYQLASQITAEKDQDGMFLTHRVPQRLTAEVMLDALNQAAGTAEVFDSFPAGTRAIALPDPAVPSYFLETFGRPLRTTTCECERPARPELRQVLHLVNGPAIDAKLSAANGRVAKLLAANKTDGEIVEELYLAGLARYPQAEELAVAQKLIARAPSRKEGVEDLLWTLINMTEFGFNH